MKIFETVGVLTQIASKFFMKVLLATHQHCVDNGLALDRQHSFTLTRSTDQDALPHILCHKV